MSAVLDQVDAGDDQQTDDAAATAAATKAAADKATADAAAAEANKQVPLAALHEAREESRQLKAQIAELERQPRLTKDDQELLADLKKQRAAAKDAPPEFLQDPKGYVDAQVKRASEALQALENGQTEIRQSADQQRQFTQLLSTVSQQEATFAAETPDYYDALKYARDIRTRQLTLIYPDATREQIATALGQEELSGAAQALRSKRNPAQVAYDYAKTMGYAAKVVEKGKTNGATTITEADKAAARTLGGSGGGGGSEVDASETEDTMPDFTAALRERFGVKRR